MPAFTAQPYVMATCRMAPLTAFADGAPLREAIDANVSQCIALAERAAGDHGARLIVFPQFGLTGYAMVSPEAWHGAALEFPGPELDQIGAAARKAGAWIVVQAPEKHAAFPGRHFLSCAIVGPDGGPVLVYRKNYSLSLRTSPVDVHARFADVFGDDAFFPVARTEIGRLAVTIGAEPHWPEACRSLALRGAEVIANPVAASPLLDYLQRPGARHARPVRAFENTVYLGMANIDGGPQAPPSAIYDYTGADVGRTAGPFVLADIDIAKLHAWREQPSADLLAQIQADTAVRPDPALHWPRDRWPEHAPADFAELVETEAAARRRLRASWR